MKQLELAGIAPAATVTKSKRKTYTGAPVVCNNCNGSFHSQMFDARLSDGRWANLCYDCFQHYGSGLGIGLGQRYVLEADGWIKVAG